MKITVVGTGYVGLVTGACFAEIGNDVTCLDINKEKIKKLKNGEIPIYEPGLKELVERNVEDSRLHFTSSYKDTGDSEAYFIAVGTPPLEDGSADLKYVFSAVSSIVENRTSSENCIIVDKSTVPVGTGRKVQELVNNTTARYPCAYFVVSNPEFLKEGKALEDFMRPDRVVIGSDCDWARDKIASLYEKFTQNGNPTIKTTLESAELIKYASNAMLATRISFVNELAQLCEKVGANIKDVSKGMGLDSRIGSKFLYAGIGYGGSCFPKDVKALIQTGKEHNVSMRIVDAVEKVNEDQKCFLVQKIAKRMGNDLKGKTFAIWGLAFKPETDDMRESPAIEIIKTLISFGAKVQVYDPKAMETAKNFYLKGLKGVKYCTKYGALENADALVLCTEWNTFIMPDWEEVGRLLKYKIVFDGKNIWHKKLPEDFDYFGVGVN